MIDNYSISIPWAGVARISSKDSKFDKALVINSFDKGTYESESGFTLGFRLDSLETLTVTEIDLNTELQKFRSRPFFGITDTDIGFARLVDKTKSSNNFLGLEDEPSNDSKSDFIDTSIKSKNYEVAVEKKDDFKYFFSPELGLLVEELQPGQTLESLWKLDLPEIDLNL